MFELYDSVRIIKTGETGIIVYDEYDKDELYMVELEDNELITCRKSEIEKIDKN